MTNNITNYKSPLVFDYTNPFERDDYANSILKYFIEDESKEMVPRQMDDKSALDEDVLNDIVNMHKSPIHNIKLIVGMRYSEVKDQLTEKYQSHLVFPVGIEFGDLMNKYDFNQNRLNLIVDGSNDIIQYIFFA